MSLSSLKSLGRRAARLQERLTPEIGLPPSYWIDDQGEWHVATPGDERALAFLPPNVYGFDPTQDGIDDREDVAAVDPAGEKDVSIAHADQAP